jgi:hypothetical protein
MPVVSRLRQTNANAASSEFTSISILESQNDWGLGRGLLGIARRVWIRSTLSESFHQVPHVTKWPQGAYRTRRCSGVLLSLLCAFMFAHPSSVMISTICIDWSRIAKCRGVLCVCTGQVKVLSSQYSKSCNWCHSPPPLSDCFSDPDCLDNLVYIRNGRGISMSLYHYTVFYGNENTMDCLFTAFERHIYWAHCWQEVWIAPRTRTTFTTAPYFDYTDYTRQALKYRTRNSNFEETERQHAYSYGDLRSCMPTFVSYLITVLSA